MGTFTLHRYEGEGLHVSVTARMIRDEGVQFRMEVAGNGYLTEREVKRFIEWLMDSHREQYPDEDEEQTNGEG